MNSWQDLPKELISLILSLCDDKTLAVNIPQVCKLFYNISNDNGDIWKARCTNDRIDHGLKDPNETWKQFYYACNIKLFPLYGFTIGKSTREEFHSVPGVSVSQQRGTRGELVLNKTTFSFDSSGVFTRLNFMRTMKTKNIPPSWSKFGFTWETSLEEYKKIFHRWNGNYSIPNKLHSNMVSLNTVAFEGNFYYLIQLTFEDRDGKLTLLRMDLTHVTNPHFIELYTKKVIND